MFKSRGCLTLFATFWSTAAFAVDGVHLIDQSTVAAAGGFPYGITAPGSYRLSSNLVATSTTAIVISTSDVTLDLNGFSVFCISCSGVPGIVSTGSAIRISNGIVTRFGGTTGKPFGIYFQGTDAPQFGARVEHVIANRNGNGIQSDRGELTVSNSTASGNTSVGIYSGGNLTVTNSTASSNGLAGIVMNNGLVSSSMIFSNGNAVPGGLRGGIQANSAIITNNLIANNPFGVYAGGNAVGLGIAIGMNTFTGNGLVGTAPILSLGNNVCSGTPGTLC